MWNLKLNKFIKEHHLFYFLVKNHRESKKLLNIYNKEYHAILSEIVSYLENLSKSNPEKSTLLIYLMFQEMIFHAARLTVKTFILYITKMKSTYSEYLENIFVFLKKIIIVEYT